MPTPQPGIFDEGSTAQYALELELKSDVDAPTLQECVAAARAIAVGGVSIVLAFSPTAWALLSGSRLEGTRPFPGFGAPDGAAAPATQRDVLIWVQGNGHDGVFDAALAAGRAFRACAAIALELRGFAYHDSRDLIGFVDGTANPKADARHAAALIPDGPGAGGAFVMSQQWVHDLDAFNALEVPEQERVVGRTKADDIELEGDAMPPDSHVARTDAKVDGVAQKIYRRSFPYGSVATHGLYFLAFACTLDRFDVQLRRMYGNSGDGLRDRLTEFSRAVTGSYWFAPSQEALDAVLN